ncbi:MAG TPA: MCP four helix bundle domain-containing protein [Saprospiraceae bacterium]|nr:MCP four helix bundle domain-containing protein [Saprospiraceae bacterium]
MVKSAFAIKPKQKVALVLLLMITFLLGGILIERYYFQQVDRTSTALYEDRLMPSTFVYQLTDRIHQRYRQAENIVLSGQTQPTKTQQSILEAYQQQMDSIIMAFELTYLVKDESASLERLKTAMAKYQQVESQFLYHSASSKTIQQLDRHLDDIRAELLQLSSIQTTVGKELLTSTESTVAQAYALSKLEISILIICCLAAQVLVLSSKSVRSPIAQKPHLN